MIMRILIVDDDQHMVELLRITMRPIASHIDSTDSLAEARRMVQEGNYNVLTLDLRLVDSGKYESMAAIREFKRASVAVVVISGLISANLKEEVMASGADAFVHKDGSFSSQAILVALNVASLKLPRESFRSDSFLEHVDLLYNLTHRAT